MTQEQVLAAVRLIPKGKVTTYALLGKFLGSRAYQAIGQMLTNNPELVVVPCHRVIATNRRVHGYRNGTQEKVRLLEAEGVRFDTDDRVSADDIIDLRDQQ